MTPKEEAIKLYSKYEQLGRDFTRGVSMNEFAKECALIAVDEIILSRKDDSQFDDTLWSGGSDMYTMHPMYLKYWQEVKQEIEKL
jgi:hypothetical protein